MNPQGRFTRTALLLCATMPVGTVGIGYLISIRTGIGELEAQITPWLIGFFLSSLVVVPLTLILLRREIVANRAHWEQAMQALQDREARMRSILETTVDGIITIDERGIVQSFNPAAETLFGYTSNEMVGKNVNRLMPAPDRDRHDGYLSNYLKSGEAKIIGIGREVEGCRKDGTVFPMALAVSEVEINGSRLFTGIVRDVTELRQTQKAIVTAGESAQEALGRELHDGMGQQLTGLTLLAKTLEKKAARENSPLEGDARNIMRVAREALDEAKRIARGLYPTVLEKYGLCVALEQLAEAQTHRHGIPCRFETEESFDFGDKSIELNLFRIAQEAVNNAARHAEAQEILIRCRSEQQRMSLTVADDGTGLENETEGTEGMGLITMQYRAGLIGGALSIRNRPDGGLLVECTLPYPAPGLSSHADDSQTEH
ncbi:MAG: PAS domain S-box protein [Verrucomicrobiota bacterium]